MDTREQSEGIMKRAREFFGAAGAKTGQLARLARIELDMVGIDRERRGVMASLGERVFDLIRRGETSRIESDVAIAQIALRARELDAERVLREREIQEIRSSVGSGGDSEPKAGRAGGAGESGGDF
jgi:hypothetical protein